ncbi:hypothetical protein NDU88_003000 [Pleurodeles waltl]|uniref:Uncharacterized protein n=1 Tax=Pleurodeles waltl TaxID=8319 RepID=A0AAV7PCJ2_PLEWA|nr:hypothetical protein NDU88_003000 [Pleurodeles waltl]
MKAYTQQSAVHHSEAWIDLVWLPVMDLLALTLVQILAHSISDHALVLLGSGTPVQTLQPMWCFSECSWKDPDCVDFIDQELRHYIRENKGSVVSAGTIWAMSKPSLRGFSKGFVRQREAQQSQWITLLEGELANLELRA